MIIRNYQPEDYEGLIGLYKNSALYGGQFDENRDSADKINAIAAVDPERILIAEQEGKIIGTVSLIEDGRVAWLFRFAVLPSAPEATKRLYEGASEILRSRGHHEVLVYAPANDPNFVQRYQDELGFKKGNDYTCFWKGI